MTTIQFGNLKMNHIISTFCKFFIFCLITFIFWHLEYKVFCILFLIISFIFFIDLLFGILYYLKNSRSYVIQEIISLDDFMIKDHPYLPFAFKEKFKKSEKVRANYPLSFDNDYFFPKIGTNNIGIVNGADGCKDVQLKKIK